MPPPEVVAVDMKDLVAEAPGAVAAFESRLWDEHAPDEPPLSKG